MHNSWHILVRKSKKGEREGGQGRSFFSEQKRGGEGNNYVVRESPDAVGLKLWLIHKA